MSRTEEKENETQMKTVGTFLRRKILAFVLMIAALLTLYAVAGAEYLVPESVDVHYQLYLPTEKPANGGFYSRGTEFRIPDYESGTGSVPV